MKYRPALRASVTVVVFAGLVVALRSLGSGRLAAPPLSFDGLSTWIDDTAPTDVAMSLVRLGAEIACWYLLAIAIVHALATFTRARTLRRVARAMTAPLPRRLGRLVVGVSLATTASPAALSGEDPLASPPTSMIALGDEANPTLPTMTDLGGVSDEIAVGGPSSASGVATGGPADLDDVAVGGPALVPRAETPRRSPPTQPEPAATWTVAAGESFWVIADETMSDLLGRPATDGEIAPYWNALVEANRHRLVDPDHPDLILPGQVFELPEAVRP